jgi:hypothetical protein
MNRQRDPVQRYPTTEAEWDALSMQERIRAALRLVEDVGRAGYRRGLLGLAPDDRFWKHESALCREQYREGYQAGAEAGRSSE